ncbi:winged helix family two component transcriptional regulator [Dongia mobilis]|uniref:Winged helix family two component transcriptional regulator n=1 Tax=Dongia mobilis TaxID=578943 RepID=A0A4R6WTT8_9PROT|nr:response regulator transcription factor [Dongia mobilis]TDQ83189.1 winged helix family two component transcriptional regulator [Dongia mobilis]
MRLLVVEDDGDLRRQLAVALAASGYAVDQAADGEDGYHLGATESYDAIVLDLGLPQLDGLSVLERWRKEGVATPVLILTARDAWTEKVRGLRSGADDYVAKPFQMEEVAARLEALIRRAKGVASAVVTVGPLTLDMAQGMVYKDGRPVPMTPLEYRLAAYMIMKRGAIVSKTEITEHIYDQSFDRDSNVVEVLINRLRKKLGTEVISTRRGQGYVLTL